MHKETKATAIPMAVKMAVWERDSFQCIVCHSMYGIPNSHVVRRSRGGMGVVENIVTHCNEHHIAYDSGDQDVIEATMNYIMEKYPGWTKERVTYSKWRK